MSIQTKSGNDVASPATDFRPASFSHPGPSSTPTSGARSHALSTSTFQARSSGLYNSRSPIFPTSIDPFSFSNSSPSMSPPSLAPADPPGPPLRPMGRFTSLLSGLSANSNYPDTGTVRRATTDTTSPSVANRSQSLRYFARAESVGFSDLHSNDAIAWKRSLNANIAPRVSPLSDFTDSMSENTKPSLLSVDSLSLSTLDVPLSDLSGMKESESKRSFPPPTSHSTGHPPPGSAIPSKFRSNTSESSYSDHFYHGQPRIRSSIVPWNGGTTVSTDVSSTARDHGAFNIGPTEWNSQTNRTHVINSTSFPQSECRATSFNVERSISRPFSGIGILSETEAFVPGADGWNTTRNRLGRQSLPLDVFDTIDEGYKPLHDRLDRPIASRHRHSVGATQMYLQSSYQLTSDPSSLPPSSGIPQSQRVSSDIPSSDGFRMSFSSLEHLATRNTPISSSLSNGRFPLAVRCDQPKRQFPQADGVHQTYGSIPESPPQAPHSHDITHPGFVAGFRSLPPTTNSHDHLSPDQALAWEFQPTESDPRLHSGNNIQHTTVCGSYPPPVWGSVPNSESSPGPNLSHDLLAIQSQVFGLSPSINGVTYGATHRPSNVQAKQAQNRRNVNVHEPSNFNNVTLESLTGRIYQTSKDQNGCRFLQKMLDEHNPDYTELIYSEIKDHIVELMTDPFGNYLCQKLLECASVEQCTTLITIAADHLVAIGFNQHGTRALQKMIEFVSTPEQVRTIKLAFEDSVVELIRDLNGNHVVQKCLNHLNSDDVQFIFDAVGANCVTVGTHRHGCCVLQRCLDHANESQRDVLVQHIISNALDLVQDAYGNYVVQYILDLRDQSFTDPLCRRFQGLIPSLSRQKFSSNVIEKCIRCSTPEVRRTIVLELINPQELESLLRDSFGNYVVQTAIEHSDQPLRSQLCDRIEPFAPILRNTSHGRRIVQRLQENRQGSSSSNHTAIPGKKKVVPPFSNR